MNAVAGTVRKVAGAATRAATMTTEAAGAIGGAALNGVIGGVKGAASGAQRGLGTGSHSTPAAALTLGALGVSGLVEWPLLVAVGGTALVLKQFNRSDGSGAPVAAPAKTSTSTARPLKSVKSTNSAKSPKSAKQGSTAPRRSPQPKKTTARPSRSGSSSARARH